MDYRQLGRTDLKVSNICLGTMTWGQQNTEEEGFEQMDYALDKGVNFFDTAEMYAVPPRAETQGATETIIERPIADQQVAHLEWDSLQRRMNRLSECHAIEMGMII